MRRPHPPSLHKTVLSVPAWRCRCWWRKPRRDWFFEHVKAMASMPRWNMATKGDQNDFWAMKEDQKSDPFGKVRQLPKVDHWSVLEKMKRSTRRFASAMKHCHQKRGVLDVFNPPEKSESHAGPSHFHGEKQPAFRSSGGMLVSCDCNLGLDFFRVPNRGLLTQKTAGHFRHWGSETTHFEGGIQYLKLSIF